MRNKKIALIYDDLYQSGGGEELFLLLTKIFPEGDVYVPIISKDYDLKLKNNISKLKTSKFLSFLANNFGKVGYYFASFLSVFWFESLKLHNYTLVISLSNRFAHTVITSAETKHVSIITSPFRQVWERSSGINRFEGSKIKKFGIKGIIKEVFYNFLRVYNYNSARRIDYIIPISSYVETKINKYWNLSSHNVLNPPLIRRYFHVQPSLTKLPFNTNTYFLMVGRLNKWKAPYFEFSLKKLSKLKKNTIIVGDGEKLDYLKNKYENECIKFVGRVSDKKLAYLYKNCLALVHPQVEDYGLTPLEALYFYKPVIAYKQGGILDYLNKNVALFYSENKTFELCVKEVTTFNFSKKEADNIIKLHSIQNFEYNLHNLIENCGLKIKD